MMKPHPPPAYFNRLRRIPWRKLLNALKISFSATHTGTLVAACLFHPVRPSDAQTLDFKTDGTYRCWKCEADGDLFLFVQRTKYRESEDLSSVYQFFQHRFNVPSFYVRPDLYSG